jgi:hypothetical protein
MSLGLLNQNLGTGSLQPMLVQMGKLFPSLLEGLFSAENYRSLTSMLAPYMSLGQLSITSAPLSLSSGPSGREPVSPLDRPDPSNLLELENATSNAQSVQWAVTTVYDQKGNFLPQWKNQFQNLAKTQEYIRLQIATGYSYHQKALNYMKELDWHELRGYLILFDFVVQNGSLNSDVIRDYLNWVQRQGTNASFTQKMEVLLELRLKYVKPSFVEDVRARKKNIIYGQGVTHGEMIRLESQFCYNGQQWLHQQ